MSDRVLPDDLEQWPSDPFALLGVPADVELRDARRAYLQLIRVYKPEFAPKEFQLIRAAFELVQQRIEIRKYFTETSSNSPESSAPITDDPSPPASAMQAQERFFYELPSSTTHSDEAAPRPPEPISAAWALAEQGEERLAIERLEQLFHQHPAEASVRLYWLKKAAAKTPYTADDSSGDQLIRGLAVAEDWRLYELLRREVERNPHLALSDSYGQLLARSHSFLVRLVESRWEACSWLGHQATIVSDLSQLETFLPRQDETSWTALLLVAIHHLIWMDDETAQMDDAAAQRCFQDCLAEVEQAAHVRDAFSWELDRMDLLFELHPLYVRHRDPDPRTRSTPMHWLELIPMSWTQPSARLRPMIFRVLAEVADNPSQAVRHFDNLARGGTALLAQLNLTFASEFRHLFGADVPIDDETLAEATMRFSRQFGSIYFDASQLLNFCWHEAIAPETLAAVGDSMHSSDESPIRRALAASPGVITTYHALRAYWG